MKLAHIKNTTLRYLILNLLILLSAFPLAGKAQQKKLVSQKDYQLWGTLQIRSISPNGKWASFEMIYENQKDTLFVINTFDKKKKSFPNGKNGRFVKEKYFLFLEPHYKLKILELFTGKIRTFPNVESYEIASSGKYIILFSKKNGLKRIMTIKNDHFKDLDSIGGITQYSLNPKGDAVIFATEDKYKNEVRIIDFRSFSTIAVTRDQSCKFSKPVWQDNGKSVAFQKETDSTLKLTFLNYFNLQDKKLLSINLSSVRSDSLLVSPIFPISISKNGQKVFFKEIEKISDHTNNTGTAEIWNGNDKWLTPEKLRMQSKGGIPRLAVWHPYSNSYETITTNKEPSARLTGQENYAIIYDSNGYGLQSKYYEDADFFLLDFKSANKKLILEKQSCDPEQMFLDQTSDKIYYYNSAGWSVYDPDLNRHTLLTSKIPTSLDNSSESSPPHQFSPYGIAGCTKDSKFVLIYDQFDIWKLGSDGSSVQRLTKGREENIVFRIAETEKNGEKLKTFDLSRKIMLSSKNIVNWSTGYFLLNAGCKEKFLAHESKEIDQILNSDNNIYIYRSQSFSSPPRIEIKKEKKRAVILFRSNKQQNNYHFGRSELIFDLDGNGKELRYALFYPADFTPDKKYPAIVYIYDTMSKNINKYVNPSMFNSDGFNITNYTLNGYFVMLPDINYTLGNTGFSASEYVNSAVESLLKKGSVDKNKIGLYGHSFGGYEANFIITRTSLFNAAVSGAGISDLVAYYFNISKNGSSRPDMWRFESQQYRIGKSLYKDKDAYLLNSPILLAEKIQTPLLLWTGKNDRIVPYEQSVSLYLALRKLKAKNMLLVYPNEDHTISTRENQCDLTSRIMSWFNFFLKDQTDCDWIKNGIAN
jgi:fermentation-respiration switch protein FrsA (DUF1100 family)